MDKLKRLRLGFKLTQLDLAKEVGVSKQYINMIEKGRRQPSMKVFVKIAKALNVSLEKLL